MLVLLVLNAPRHPRGRGHAERPLDDEDRDDRGPGGPPRSLLAPAGAPAPAAVPSAVVPAGLAAALIPCFYAYGGYHMTMNLGADVKDARRRFPLAVTAGMLAVVGLYLAINVAYVRTLGVARRRGVEARRGGAREGEPRRSRARPWCRR